MVKTKVEGVQNSVRFNTQGKCDVGEWYPKGSHCSEWGQAEVCQYRYQPSGAGDTEAAHALHEWDDDVSDGFADPGRCSNKADGHAAYDKEHKLKVDAVDVFLLNNAKAWESEQCWEQYKDISELLLVNVCGNDVKEDNNNTIKKAQLLS